MDSNGAPASRQRQWIRWSGVAWVTLFLFWLPVEDVTLGPALGLGGTGMGWLYVRWQLGRQGAGRGWLWGAAAGVLVPGSAAALLVFKTGVHGHGFSELPLARLGSLLPQVPLWGLAGIGFGYLVDRWRDLTMRQED